MKTLRAFLFGSALGALVGLFLAPQRDTIAQAQLAEERGKGQRAGASGAQATTTTPEARTQTQPATAPVTPTVPTTTAAQPSGSSARRYVGNLNTRIYHEATDANLPNEENRAYFATPEEAEAAGYRPAQL